MKTTTTTKLYNQSTAERLIERLDNRLMYLQDLTIDTPSVQRQERWQGQVSIRAIKKAITLLSNLMTTVSENIDNGREPPLVSLVNQYLSFFKVAGLCCDQVLGRTAVAILDKLFAR